MYRARAQMPAALIEVHPNWTRLKARNPSASGMLRRVRTFELPRAGVQRAEAAVLLKHHMEGLERILETLEALRA